VAFISIIIPVCNEEENIPVIAQALANLFGSLESQDTYELLFVNDGSSDSSSRVLDKLAQRDVRVKYLEFSRNFGKEIATSAGLDHVHGDAVIILDADLQHPVERIPEFLEKWRKGADIVVGIRENQSGEGLVKKTGSYCYYKLHNLIGAMPIIPGSTDFRLLDRAVVREFRRLKERNRMTRYLIDWLGFTRDYVYFTAPGRQRGVPQYSFMKLWRLAFSGLIANSLLPLKIGGYLGLFITLVSGVAGVSILAGRVVFHTPFALSFTGPALLAILIVFLVGIILVCLGTIALYIANIHDEILGRPMYVIKRHNLSSRKSEL